MLAATAWGCQGLTASSSSPVAVEFALPQSPPLTVEEYDTVVVGVRVRDRAGDTIPGAAVRVTSLMPDTVGVDSTRHFGIVGLRKGTGRVVALSGSLQSDPLAVTVTAAPDSLTLIGQSVDTVAATDTVSAPLVVQLLDLHSDSAQATGLTAKPVSFTVVTPVFDSLAAATATLSNDSLTAVVLTGSVPEVGAASVTVRRQGPPPQPDSVVVEARATRANGGSVRGSPVTFVVHFQ